MTALSSDHNELAALSETNVMAHEDIEIERLTVELQIAEQALAEAQRRYAEAVAPIQ